MPLCSMAEVNDCADREDRHAAVPRSGARGAYYRAVSTNLIEQRLQYARVLVEIGELDEAEREIADQLDDHPDDLASLNLLAKIKHIKGELSQAIACWAQLHARSPHNELTLMCLSALLQIAKDPARGAG